MEKEIFIVHETGYLDEMNHIDSVFDSFEKAEAYTKRYKENSKFSIMKKVVNPVYNTNKEASPYYVQFRRDEFKPTEAELMDYSLEDEDAANSQFYISREEGTNKLDEFEQYVFAASLEEAVALVRKNRDDVLAKEN